MCVVLVCVQRVAQSQRLMGKCHIWHQQPLPALALPRFVLDKCNLATSRSLNRICVNPLSYSLQRLQECFAWEERIFQLYNLRDNLHILVRPGGVGGGDGN